MFRTILLMVLTVIITNQSFGQSDLSVAKIMEHQRDWMGTAPSNVRWDQNGSALYFSWNPNSNPQSSTHKYDLIDKKIVEVSPEKERDIDYYGGVYNEAKTKKLLTQSGDIYLKTLNNESVQRITNTFETEHNPKFSKDEKHIIFFRGNIAFQWSLENGNLKQLNAFDNNNSSAVNEGNKSKQEIWLKEDQDDLFEVLKDRRASKKYAQERRNFKDSDRATAVQTHGRRVTNVQVSPEGRFIVYRIGRSNSGKRTSVPNYVTESGYIENLNARSKVGGLSTDYKIGIYDRQRDSIYEIDFTDLEGLLAQPKYYKVYKRDSKNRKRREIIPTGFTWSPNGKYLVSVLRSSDNKDRWVVEILLEKGHVKKIDRQTDQAWIGGPGISSWNYTMGSIGWMPDGESVWFQTEKSGYSHINSVNLRTGKRTIHTKGKYEIYNPSISNDEQYWYYTSNEVHPGERHFYRKPISGGKAEKLTHKTGANIVTISPDEKYFAIRHSYSNKPVELYLQENKAGAKPVRITHSTKKEWEAYPWRDPEIIQFKASDGKKPYARLYKPKNAKPGGPAVIFVHGAGYLQNAHKYWSTYSREYMFHNLLVDHGYTVLDIDYRGSSGYGRDWRTGIYRHMGGKDLSDHIDGAKYLVDEHGIDAKRIGIYGGSYGGFITLMALFNEPGTFKAGAALRSVTDWAHYNHGYTSNILNTPELDSIAYKQSSPIYFAEGLQDHLLICHGILDTNVQFQDVVRLSQRLIELGKVNWELAVYPLEGHGFQEPSSWTDEYSRIFKLFETHLK